MLAAVKKSIVVVVCVMLLLTSTSCRTRRVLIQVEADVAGAKGKIHVEVEREPCPCPCPVPLGSQIFETREIDPSVLADDPNGEKSGIIYISLASGQTVTLLHELVHDSGTYLPPITSGNSVLVYRPADPAAVVQFLESYWDQALGFKTVTKIDFLDVSGGGIQRTTVDIRQAVGETEYVGSATVVPPTYQKGRFFQDS